MSKRFTDTEKWGKGFIRSLQAPYKLLWLYICDSCNHAGIWDVEIDVAELRIGVDLTCEEALKQFGEHVVEIEDGRKWFIPSFVEFQYGELNPENRAHRAVIDILNRYDLKPLTKPLTTSFQGRKDKEKDKEKDNSLGKSAEKTLSSNPLDPEWSDYLEMRKKIRKPATEKAQQLAIQALEKLSPGNTTRQKAILNQSTLNSWQGLFELKADSSQAPNNPQEPLKHAMYRVIG